MKFELALKLSFNFFLFLQGSKSSLIDHVQHSLNEHIKILCEAALSHKDLLLKHGSLLKEFEETVADHRHKVTVN